ncbi:lysophospholipid acyltransferase 5 [Bactrocera dorsalis]|uniref:Lysophospholipid acyltransferase 5 n=1 Tax=Bactrocera dorsalis TaxID=27457 RepID=A0A6I9UM08_BACDO|nr:lysophospholipid acyltransferase 5 [Bactrocera dorsalis]XP_019844629.2 lysophospholipid acyltransferase 5 [Bactrocera dorsalis]XP_049314803.1 lysophospholipid acyltransferase 5 [Bactrocera dorsalis]
MSTLDGAAVPALGLIGKLAQSFGVNEAALRLLLSIFGGYGIAVLYRKHVVGQPNKQLHHLYFVICGLLICLFNFGLETYHSLIAITTTYVLARLLRGCPREFKILNFVFHMSYLLVGYHFTESDEYDILWTMPHCVLVLRLIGFGFDLADGLKEQDKLSKEQKECALAELPSPLELFAFAYLPCSFLIGPQFPYRRYKRFIEGEFKQHDGNLEAGLKRMSVGFVYLIVSQIGAVYFPNTYILSDEYAKVSYFWRLAYLGVWAKVAIYKYVACWLLTEGALIILGISYAGKQENGKHDWSGCSNVNLIILETGYTMQHYVHSFNINTNQWLGQYVYKRLKFLNNRTISYAAALGFLAVWHGFHSGYYMAFFNEYMTVTVEKQFASVWAKTNIDMYADIVSPPFVYPALKYFIQKLYDLFVIGWCMTPFILLSYSRWMKAYSAVNYFVLIGVLVWTIFYQTYKYYVRAAKRREQDSTFGRATTLSPTINDGAHDKRD